ncbi:MAG TPA: group 1 truncated hemoglobin [Kineosporiaceae bacterium]
MTTDETTAQVSLYDRLGGAATIGVAVQRFYDRLLADPQLADYFRDVDLPRLKRHQVLVIGNVLGGPAAYEGPGLEAAHASLGITDADYDAVGAHLLATLAELGAGEEAAAAVTAALEAVRLQIVAPPV